MSLVFCVVNVDRRRNMKGEMDWGSAGEPWLYEMGVVGGKEMDASHEF